jgi:hypothetical protein
MRESPEELGLKPPSISRLCSSTSAATAKRGAPISMPAQAIGSQHPGCYHAHQAGRRLDVNKLPGDTLLAVSPPYTVPVKRVPTVMDLELLTDIDIPETTPAPDLLRLAAQILDSKLRSFDPSGFRDRYKEALMARVKPGRPACRRSRNRIGPRPAAPSISWRRCGAVSPKTRKARHAGRRRPARGRDTMQPYNNTSPTSDPDGAVYLVLDDFGRFGRAYRETDVSAADRQTVIANLLSGQYV